MHQYLFFIGDFPIRMYGLMLCTAIFLATGTAYFLAKQDGRWHEHILDIGIYGGFAGLIGGRLWDVFFFDWDYYSHHLLEIPFVWQGGMAVQGGMLAGIAAGIVYCKLHNIDWVALADIVSPSLLIGQSIGRMAKLLNGDRRQLRYSVPGRYSGLQNLRPCPPVAGGGLGRSAGYRNLCPAAFIPHHQACTRSSFMYVRHALFRSPLLFGNAAR